MYCGGSSGGVRVRQSLADLIVITVLTPTTAISQQVQGRNPCQTYTIVQAQKYIQTLPFCRVQQVHEKWVNIRTLLQTKLINILNIHTNPDFKFLAECTEWVTKKLVSFGQPY